MLSPASSHIKVLAQPNSVKGPDAFASMPDEYQELTKHLMLVHTEGEITGADDYTQIFYPMAPNAYEKQVCCERASEEVQHYLLGAKVLKDIGVDTDYMVGQNMMERPLYPNELVRGVQTWMERGVFSFLGEAVVLDHLVEFSHSSYEPFAQIFRDQIIKDEHVHVAHGYRIIRDACKDPDTKAEAQEALTRFWPIVLDLFGRSDSKRSPLYVRWGLRTSTNNELRDRFISKIVPRLVAMGLEVPDHKTGRKFI